MLVSGSPSFRCFTPESVMVYLVLTSANEARSKSYRLVPWQPYLDGARALGGGREERAKGKRRKNGRLASESKESKKDTVCTLLWPAVQFMIG